jgi:hypothetical protein
MKASRFSFFNINPVVLLIVLAVLFLPILLIERSVLQYTGGVFIYPYDDTFIHMEIAKHLATEGVWGINNGEFGSASSSLLYTIVLTVARFISSSVTVPFIINCLAGLMLVFFAHRWLSKQQVRSFVQIIILSAAVLLTPLATLIISGMEHTLQTLLVFIFIFQFADWLERYVNGSEKRLNPSIILLAVLVATIRYESLFIIGMACLLLFVHKKFKAGILLGSAALLPIVLFGLYSVSKGSFFLPNSVLVKADSPDQHGMAGFINTVLFDKLVNAKTGLPALATQRWLLILPVLYLVFKKYMRPSYSFILIMLMGVTLLHLALAATGWLYRYEAYLFFSAIVITGVILFKHLRDFVIDKTVLTRVVFAVLLLFAFLPVVLRGMTALSKTKQACINIYEQQYQMAKFSNQYYYNAPLAINDIGAIAYFTDAKIVDLWGLATTEVAKSRKEKYWTSPFLDSLSKANKVPIAMVYDVWFDDGFKDHWYKVASWQIQNNIICGDDEVSFYALDSTHVPVLKQQLVQFQPQLPRTVTVQYFR